jgi:UDP-GlcNAc:undecaprenyl-phosphate/decaprenyl-phosphate GlcNAc-1-phosphate transferase
VHALPFILALITAIVLAPALLRGLAAGGHTRPNYRDRELVFPFGLLSLAAPLLALVPLMLIQVVGGTAVFHPETGTIAIYVLGVAALGLIDDVFAGSPRGWRGHLRAVLHGELSTGALKAAGSLGLALFAIGFYGLSTGRWLLAAAVLVLATNLFNLLDLRPGRASKVFVLLGIGLSIGCSNGLRSLWSLGLFAAPALVAGLYDLRERAMLGDTGANLLGGLAGLWLVLTLSETGQAVALGLLVLVTIYGEFRSISELVARTPGLRELDSWGRPS